MKNQIKKLLLLALVSSFVFVFSCGETDTEEPLPTAPSISVSATVNGTAVTSPFDVQPGDSLGFSITIVADGGFNVYRISQSVDEGTPSTIAEVNRNDLSLTAGAKNASDLGSISPISADLVGHTVILDFDVVDDSNQSSTTSIEFDVVSPDATSYTAVLLYAPTTDKTNKNFFSVSEGKTYSGSDVTSTSEAVSPKIDFGYYYGNTNEASIASPAAFVGLSTTIAAQVENWGTKNSTTLKTTTMTAAQFAEASTFADIDAAFAAGTTDSDEIITKIAVGQVIAFQTAAGVKGLIHVTAIDGTFNSNDKITIEVIAAM